MLRKSYKTVIVGVFVVTPFLIALGNNVVMLLPQEIAELASD